MNGRPTVSIRLSYPAWATTANVAAVKTGILINCCTVSAAAASECRQYATLSAYITEYRLVITAITIISIKNLTV